MKRHMLCVRSEPAPTYLPNEQAVIDEALSILARRLRQKGAALNDPVAAAQYLQLRFGALEHEVFVCIYLDTWHHVLACEEMFRGTIDGAEVHPREVAKRALQLNAAAVVFSHNHPSGALEFSASDIAVTARLKMAMQIFEIRVLDHILVTSGGHLSMAQLGHL